jgi:hypothetical protein
MHYSTLGRYQTRNRSPSLRHRQDSGHSSSQLRPNLSVHSNLNGEHAISVPQDAKSSQNFNNSLKAPPGPVHFSDSSLEETISSRGRDSAEPQCYREVPRTYIPFGIKSDSGQRRFKGNQTRGVNTGYIYGVLKGQSQVLVAIETQPVQLCENRLRATGCSG